MRLTFVVSSLACGGGERSAILLAQGLIEKGHKILLITFEGHETDFYEIPNGVQRVSLNINKKSPNIFHAIWNNINRLKKLRQEIITSQPDIVISFLDVVNILTLLSLINSRYPIIVSEQNNPAMSTQNFWKIWSYLRKFSYSFAAKVVSSSQGVDEYFTWLSTNKRLVIYNPLASINTEVDNSILVEGLDLTKNWIIAMGRLTYQKGFDILLLTFAQIADKHPDWQLLILGEGELRKELENLRDSLGLTKKVILAGIIKNPFPILKNSKLFVLSSRFEGFGNVLVEAMACGLPVISTDCQSGPREIIQDGFDGILVPTEDVLSLGKEIDFLMLDEQERQRLGNNACITAKRFSLDNIVCIWDKLINEVYQGK